MNPTVLVAALLVVASGTWVHDVSAAGPADAYFVVVGTGETMSRARARVKIVAPSAEQLRDGRFRSLELQVPPDSPLARAFARAHQSGELLDATLEGRNRRGSEPAYRLTLKNVKVTRYSVNGLAELQPGVVTVMRLPAANAGAPPAQVKRLRTKAEVRSPSAGQPPTIQSATPDETAPPSQVR